MLFLILSIIATLTQAGNLYDSAFINIIYYFVWILIIIIQKVTST